jgi:hypothetical protein
MKKHKFSETRIKHHGDGTHTVHHVHEDDAKKDLHHAVPDLDAVHDKLEENIGEPNDGEAAMQAPPAAAGAAPVPGAMPAGMGM